MDAEMEGKLRTPQRILVLTLSFGEGHVSAARAIADEFRRQAPESEVRVLDVLEHCSPLFRAFYAYPYWLMIRHAPGLWRFFFRSRTRRKDEFTAPVWAWCHGCKTVFNVIDSYRPDIIVACEVGACEIAAIARRQAVSSAQVINVITDLEAEPIWVKPEIETYYVPDDRVKHQLVKWGADPACVHVCGIPIDQRFARASVTSSSIVRRSRRPMVLLMGGGMGPTRMDLVADTLLRRDAHVQIVALPGKDLSVRNRLKRLGPGSDKRLTVVDWTERVADYMKAASVLVTKPGGLTLSEASACGVPLVLFDVIPGPEEVNAEAYVNAGAAVLAGSPAHAADEVIKLLADAEKLAAMSRSVSSLSRPDPAQRIVATVLKRYRLNEGASIGEDHAIEFTFLLKAARSVSAGGHE